MHQVQEHIDDLSVFMSLVTEAQKIGHQASQFLLEDHTHQNILRTRIEGHSYRVSLTTTQLIFY